MKSLVIEILNGEQTLKKPFWMMRQAGRYLPEYRALRQHYENFLDLCTTPHAAAEATLQPLRRFPLDAAIIFSDILVIPWALGQHVHFLKGKGPVLSRLQHPDDLGKISTSFYSERLYPTYEALSLVKAHLPSSVALYGFAGAPWTLATYMIEGGSSRDFKQTLEWAYYYPEELERLFFLLEKTIAEHLIQQVRAGATVLQLFDSWAGSVPDTLFEKLVIQPTKRIVENVRNSCPTIPIVGFAKGIGNRLHHYAAATTVQAIGLDSGVSLSYLKSHPLLLPTQGNIDPVALRTGGAALEKAVCTVLEQTKTRPHIVNLGHGILPDTPIAHVHQLVEKIQSWNKDTP
jgi:uroporphyrinogen decarboxylase